LHSFWGGDGLDPSGSLLRDQTGTRYGAALVGGTPEGGGCIHGCGAVFKLDKTGKETVLYAFTGLADGEYPAGELARDESGNVYGITELGGDFSCDDGGCGVAFKVDDNGKETVLHTFTGFKDGDGEQPSGGLIRDRAGNLYGATVYGGTSTNCYEPGCGAAFKIDANGTETVLHSFAGAADGLFPDGPLIRDSDGNLYGTARGGNSSCQCGVVFKLDTIGKETVLYTFKGSPDEQGTVVGEPCVSGIYNDCL
jgi:uncharacterized repeat protein (TIGR03803 family)